MKLITLNLWGGKLYNPLIEFIKTHSDNVDIFCFQDLLFGAEPNFSPVHRGRINIYEEIKEILFNFNSYKFLNPKESLMHGEILSKEVGCGQAIFVRKNLKVLSSGNFMGCDKSTYMEDGLIVDGRCQWVRIENGTENFSIMNVHGIWQKDSMKRDTPERIEQSRRIKEFFDGQNCKKILCGDFNIINDGEAMVMLEDGMINLIKKYNITSTRSSHYPKEEKFADYVLVSKDIEVKDFQVLPDEVSDHLPLLLDFK
jgi:exonuclease III